MAKVTPGFKLYLYQLLSRQLGFGKQTLLPRVEEVLAEDDIIPQDLECDTVQELVEACPDFLKLTIFKKGRAYATVLRNEEWDQMLAAPPDKQEATTKKNAGGPKTWKKKKGGKKVLKAVKPGKKRRDREAEQARAEEEARLAALAEQEAAAKQEAELPVAEHAEEVPVATIDEATAEVPVEATSNEAPASDTLEVVEDEQDAQPHITAPTLAEVLAQAREAEAAAQAEANQDASPQDTVAPVDAAEVTAPSDPSTGAQDEPAPYAQVDSAIIVLEEAKTETGPMPTATPSPLPETSISPETTATEPTETAPEAPDTDEAPATLELPQAPEPSPISLTITYNPYEDMERELARQRTEQEQQPALRAPRPQQAPTTPPSGPVSPIPLDGLPQDFSSEVSCKDALLRTLYQLLPYEVEPLAVLDEDWRVARSTSSLSGSRNRVSFPLRYLHEDGTPIQVTLRKATRTSFGKRWNLALVDGDDGSGSSHEAVGFEGLPAADEGAWSDLSTSTLGMSISPVRELAQEVVIGTWDSFLGSLAAMAAPERWNLPGEGVGKATRYGILRDYVACTFHRALCQQRYALSGDGTFAALNTGLLTSFGEDIYACASARSGDIPWRFEGFATAGSGELGARLIGAIAELPEQPSYLSSLECVMPLQGRLVILDLEAILGKQLGRLPHAFLAERLEGNAEASDILGKGTRLSADDLARLARIIKQDGTAYRRIRRALDDAVEQAMRSVKASFRLAAPVYDPVENQTKLMIPLCLVEYGKADCALVLELQPSGAYRAATVLSLSRAYACARVISREQPGWLQASRVL